MNKLVILLGAMAILSTAISTTPNAENPNRNSEIKLTFNSENLNRNIRQGYGRKENIADYITNSNIGDFSKTPSDAEIINRMTESFGLPADLVSRILVTSRGSGFARVSARQDDFRFTGQVVVSFAVGSALGNRPVQVADKPEATPFTDVVDIWNSNSDLGNIRGNLRSGITDESIINRFLAFNRNLPKALAPHLRVTGRHNGGRPNRLMVVSADGYGQSVVIRGVMYSGTRDIDYRVHDE